MAAPDPIAVTVRLNGEATRKLAFREPFRIGRGGDCDVCIPDRHVSRCHAIVELRDGAWRLTDLESSNGIFVNGRRTRSVVLVGNITVTLGIAGPSVTFECAPSEQAPEGETLWLRRHLEDSVDQSPSGEQTMMIRRALKRVQARHRRRNALIVGLLLTVIGGAAIYAAKLRAELRHHLALAQDLFYSMKSVDVDIARAERNAAEADGGGQERIRGYRRRREELEENYNRFLSALNIYGANLSAQDRLILRVARIFGESEIDMPAGFREEVARYIGKWRSTGRFSRALETARKNGYTEPIEREFLERDLPPQFFYLAMQESNFDVYDSGPPTRKGIAKGMWQFIPETAVRYGLGIGPLADTPRPDPGDDRDRFDRATRAAARYIKDLYATDAQASGLLVMACYNWGDDRVLPLVRSLPENPRERNFWKLLERYRDRLPGETYDYVFYIVSAAVIGEDPRLFGFDFDNPLAQPGAR